MTVMVDENLSRAIHDVFCERGHRVLFIAHVCPGAKDAEILATADHLGAVIVTQNHKDFVRDVSRMHPPDSPRIRRAGRLSVTVAVPKPGHVERALPLVEAEYERRLSLSDSRLIAEISEHHVKFEL